jgi:hypothetical protein
MLASSGVADAFPPQYVNALQRARYQVFRADINSDGIIDFLLKARRQIVLIDYDVPIPVPLRSPSATFLLRSSGGSYVLEVNPAAATVANPAWQASTDELIYGDVLGVGSNAMMIRARVSGSASFVIVTRESDGQPVLLQHLTASQLGPDLGAANVTVTLTDVTRDGRADLIVRTNGMITNVFAASTDGLFVRPSSDEQASAAAWHAFAASLNAGDAQSALGFITTDSVPKYSAALAALGGSISTLTQNWSGLVPISVRPSYAVYLVRENYAGVQRGYLVTIVVENGRWLIDEF